ncbi:MAG: MBL fold metallo-hydrolase [Betaproteobacteria bacterium]|nr:MAG: MBL fold metallo-hydrolase [Betaproteobacteria bacterium]
MIIALVTALTLLCSGIARAQAGADAAPAFFKLVELAPGVFAATDIDGKAGANAGFVIGDDGVLVVDSFYKPEAAQALLAEIHKRTALPLRFLVNTHYHIDHVSGNRIFAAAGAQVIGQQRMHDWVQSENMKFLGSKATDADRERIRNLLPPQLGYGQTLHVWLGRRSVLLRSWPGHTGSDTVAYVPDAGVMFGGDLLWSRSIPNLIDATVAQWTQSLERMAEDEGVRYNIIVPGHGEVASQTELAEFKTYLTELRGVVAKLQRQGLAGDALQDAALEELNARYGSWRYNRLMRSNVRDMADELAGTKRLPGTPQRR